MCVQIIGQFVSKIEVFGHFLEIASLDFSSFAYYDRLDWYLTTLGGCCSRKKFLLCYFAYWRASICEKTHFLEIASLDFSSFAYYDRQAWYLTTSGGRCSKEKFLLWYFAYWRRQYVKKFIFLLYYFIRTRLESLWNQHRQSVSLSVCLSVTKVLILPTIRFFWFFASS